MPDDTFAVADVAALLAVSGPTVRRWSGEFAGHLSELATPPKGGQREFTHDDVKLLLYCKRRLVLGLSVAAVRQELPTAELPTWAEVMRETGMISTDSAATGVTIATEQVLGAFVASQARLADNLAGLVAVGELRQAITDLQRQLAAIEGRLDALERVSRGHPAIVPRNRP